MNKKALLKLRDELDPRNVPNYKGFGPDFKGRQDRIMYRLLDAILGEDESELWALQHESGQYLRLFGSDRATETPGIGRTINDDIPDWTQHWTTDPKLIAGFVSVDAAVNYAISRGFLVTEAVPFPDKQEEIQSGLVPQDPTKRPMQSIAEMYQKEKEVQKVYREELALDPSDKKTNEKFSKEVREFVVRLQKEKDEKAHQAVLDHLFNKTLNVEDASIMVDLDRLADDADNEEDFDRDVLPTLTKFSLEQRKKIIRFIERVRLFMEDLNAGKDVELNFYDESARFADGDLELQKALVKVGHEVRSKMLGPKEVTELDELEQDSSDYCDAAAGKGTMTPEQVQTLMTERARFLKTKGIDYEDLKSKAVMRVRAEEELEQKKPVHPGRATMSADGSRAWWDDPADTPINHPFDDSIIGPPPLHFDSMGQGARDFPPELTMAIPESGPMHICEFLPMLNTTRTKQYVREDLYVEMHRVLYDELHEARQTISTLNVMIDELKANKAPTRDKK